MKEYEERYYVDGVLNKARVIEDLQNYEPELIALLINNEVVRKIFLLDINGSKIIKINDLIEIFEMNEYWDDSYTAYENKIGLTSNRKFLSETTDVVLDYPYKDTVLKASMSKEERDKEDLLPKEPFLNEKIAREEIDTLLDNKVLINTRKYDEEGEHGVNEFTGEDNLILKGNNLMALHSLKDRFAGKIKLIYIDPPFNTGNDSFLYNDKFSRSTWLTFMKNRLSIAKELLDFDGNIFVHIDDNQFHYLKILMDELFGEENYVETFIWSYGSASGGRSASAKPVNVHDYILQYSKNYSNRKANKQYTPYSEKYIKDWFKHTDEDGRLYQRRQRGRDENGNAIWSRQYLDESKGVPLTTVWNDINQVYANPQAYKEENRATSEIELEFGNSGQKPEKLLERIIKMSTDEGDYVLDFFMGSGTTAAAAMKLNRKFITVEQLENQLDIAINRMNEVIIGKQSGISKDVNWHGGGSFIYAELMEKNTGYLKDVLNAESTDRLREIFNLMLEYADFDFQVDLEEVKDSVWRLPLEDQKRTLVKIIDKNQLYYNYSEIDDEDVRDLISASDLYTQNENAMGASAYAENKLVVLGDEAHHYSASTKSEKETERSWENAINTILSARNDNLLLEFTATIDLENKNIYEKYKDKIIYQYALDRYIVDKYSKNIKRIQSNNSDKDNMLNVMLLSEFRRRLARERFDTFIKPVILFKSQRIADSNEAEEQFNELVEDLSVDMVKNFINRQRQLDTLEESETLELAYTYYEKNEDRLVTIIQDMKREFNPNRVINANDSAQSGILEKGQYEALNSLESPNNLYRVIFAVAKLTEGWDVLNLYDIVRISDAPKTSGTKSQTNSVAQLIGRGARYNPFELEGGRSYQRRFEDDSMPNLLLETLHYHTINEPQYLKNLVNSLDDMNLPTGVDEKNPLLDVKLKPSFKKTNTYKKGKIYYNDVVDVPESYYDGLDKYGIDNQRDVVIPWLKATRELSYKAGFRVDKGEGMHNIPVIYDKRYLTKAFARNKFYHFENLKRFLPQLNSMDEFLDANWLNLKNRTLYASVPLKITRNDLTPVEKLSIIEMYLDEVEQKIKNGYQKQRGTSRFIGYPIKDYISNYRKRVPNYDTADYYAPQFVERYEIKEDFFVYDHAIVNRTEKQLIDRVTERIPELEEKYDNVYLIRMDENMHRESAKDNKLKLHQFEKNPDETHYSGFQPDFILLIDDSDYYIQIFIEPKAEGRYQSEKWKEDILKFINNNEAELIIDDEINNVKIKGLKFYFMNDTNGTMKQLGEMTLGREFKGLSIEEI